MGVGITKQCGGPRPTLLVLRPLTAALCTPGSNHPEVIWGGASSWHRERDGQAGGLNLFRLLHGMEAHVSHLDPGAVPWVVGGVATFPTRLIDEQFEQCGGPPGPGTPDDHIPAAAIAEDRAQLQHETSHRGARSSGRPAAGL